MINFVPRNSGACSFDTTTVWLNLGFHFFRLPPWAVAATFSAESAPALHFSWPFNLQRLLLSVIAQKTNAAIKQTSAKTKANCTVEYFAKIDRDTAMLFQMFNYAD